MDGELYVKEYHLLFFSTYGDKSIFSELQKIHVQTGWLKWGLYCYVYEGSIYIQAPIYV